MGTSTRVTGSVLGQQRQRTDAVERVFHVGRVVPRAGAEPAVGVLQRADEPQRRLPIDRRLLYRNDGQPGLTWR